MDNDLITRYNEMIGRVTGGIDHATLALDLEDALDTIEELSDLIGDLEDERDILKATCIGHGWNPDSTHSEVE